MFQGVPLNLQVIPHTDWIDLRVDRFKSITRDHLDRMWFIYNSKAASFQPYTDLWIGNYDGAKTSKFKLLNTPEFSDNSRLYGCHYLGKDKILLETDGNAPLSYIDLNRMELKEIRYQGKVVTAGLKYLVSDSVVFFQALIAGEHYFAKLQDTTFQILFPLPDDNYFLIGMTADRLWAKRENDLLGIDFKGQVRTVFPLPYTLWMSPKSAVVRGDQIYFLDYNGVFVVYDIPKNKIVTPPYPELVRTMITGIYPDQTGNLLFIYSSPHTFQAAYLLTASGELINLQPLTKSITEVTDVYGTNFMEGFWICRLQSAYEVRLHPQSVQRYLDNASMRKIGLDSTQHMYAQTEADGMFKSPHAAIPNWTLYKDVFFGRLYWQDTKGNECYNTRDYILYEKERKTDTIELGMIPHDIIEWDDHHLMVADANSGIRLIDVESGQKQTLYDAKIMTIHQLAKINDHTLAQCSEQGLLLVDTKTPEPHQVIDHQSVICLSHLEGEDWVAGTNSGYLIKISLPAGKVTDTLAYVGSAIVTITPDDRSRLWIGTFSGIYVYQQDTKLLLQLDDDLVRRVECNRFSSWFDSTYHRMWIGSLEGLYAIDIRTARFSHFVPKVILSLAAYFDFRSGKQDTFYFNGQTEHTIRLSAYHRSFTVVVAPGIESGKDVILYYYLLQPQQNSPGPSSQWTENGSNPSVTMANLSSGDYTLWIKSTASGTQAESNYVKIPIHVAGYFYTRWWFYTLVIILLSMIAYWRYLFLKRENIRLEDEVHKRTLELQLDKETIQQQAEALTELDSMKNRFYSNISHELKTPLSLIKGPLESLLTGEHPERQKELLTLIKRNAGLLGERVDELLELSRLDRNMVQLHVQPMNMDEFLDQHVFIFQQKAKEAGIHLQILSHFDQPVYAFDAPKVGKMIQNLIANAIKYCPPDSQVGVDLRIVDEVFYMSVEDNGPGIPQRHQERIFEKFYQLPDSRHQHDPGSGIGLSIVKEYTELMHGQLKLESEEGKGSRFMIQLPVARVGPESLQEIPVSHAEESHVTDLEEVIRDELPAEAHLLVVEDNADLRSFLQLILSSKFKVTLVENGKVAIDRLSKQADVDLVLSDIMMPVMDGMELLKEVRSHPSLEQMPFIFLTAKQNEISRISALRLGVDDYITKPFSEQELLLRIARLLHHAKMRKEAVAEELKSPEPSERLQHDDSSIIEIQEYIRQHLSDPTFNAEAVAQHLGISERTLRRYLQRETGMSTKEFIIEVQMDQLRQLRAANRHSTVADLASQVGYMDHKYMAKLFYTRWGYKL